MENQIITIKLNRFTSYIQQHQTQTPAPSPNDILTIILFYLNQCLSTISNFISETRSRLPDLAGHWFLITICILLLIIFLCCCLPPILRCTSRVLVGILNIIKGFFENVFSCLCCCGRRQSGRMMKAPGRGGRVFIPRASFESDPRAYFQTLRGGYSPLS